MTKTKIAFHYVSSEDSTISLKRKNSQLIALITACGSDVMNRDRHGVLIFFKHDMYLDVEEKRKKDNGFILDWEILYNFNIPIGLQ